MRPFLWQGSTTGRRAASSRLTTSFNSNNYHYHRNGIPSAPSTTIATQQQQHYRRIIFNGSLSSTALFHASSFVATTESSSSSRSPPRSSSSFLRPSPPSVRNHQKNNDRHNNNIRRLPPQQYSPRTQQQQQRDNQYSEKVPFVTTLFRENRDDALRLLQSKTNSLLDDHPIGTWTPCQWQDAIQVLRLWTSRDASDILLNHHHHHQSAETFRHNKNQEETVLSSSSGDSSPQKLSNFSGTPESVLSSFALLERLLVELRRRSSTTAEKQQQQQSFAPLLANNNKDVLIIGVDTELLNSVIHNWSTCWIDLHSSSKKIDGHLAATATGAAKVLLEFQPGNILSRIDAYKSRSNGLLTPNHLTYLTIMEAAAASKTPSIAVKILDQMVKESSSANDDTSTNAKVTPFYLSPTSSSNSQFDKVGKKTYVKFIYKYARMGDAAQAEACLEYMYQQYEKTGAKELKPATSQFNKILLAWTEATTGDLQYASERSQSILRRMKDLSAKGGALEGIANPDYLSYGLVLKSLSRWLESAVNGDFEKVKEYAYAAELAESLLDEMEDLAAKGGRKLKPNATNYRAVLKIFSFLGFAERAEALLQRQFLDFTANNNRRAEPCVTAFNEVLNAWDAYQKNYWATDTTVLSSSGTGGKEKTTEIAERADAIFRRMQELDRSGELSNVKPNRRSYALLLSCWSNSRTPQAGERAMAILREAENIQKETGQPMLGITAYGAVIHAYSASGDAENAEKAARAFHKQYYEKGNRFAQPTLFSMTTLISAWSRSTHPDADLHAERILQEMHRLYGDGILLEAPNEVAYTAVLESYTKARRPGSAERAESILLEMDRRARNGEVHIRPSSASYRNVISAFAAAGNFDKAEEIFDRMLEDYSKRGNKAACVTTKTIGAVLIAYANSRKPDAARRAVAFTRRLEQLFDKGRIEAKPNVVCYTIVLKCFANSTYPDAGLQAEKLIDDMEARASRGETAVAPNTMTYSTVIQLYGRIGEAEKAEALLERMYSQYQKGNKETKPNTRTFTSVLLAWSRSAVKNPGERAMAILNRMKELHNTGVLDDVRPNGITYAAVLGCVTKSDTVLGRDSRDFAVSLLDEMEELAKAGDEDLKRSLVSYNNAGAAFSRIGDGVGAQELIARMYHRHQQGIALEKPNIISWNSVLEAWSNCDDPNASLRALAILERIGQLNDSGVLEERPNCFTYLMVLKCCLKSKHRSVSKHILPLLDEYDKLGYSGDDTVTVYDQLTLIRSLCQTRDDDLLARAELILRRIVRNRGKSSQRWNANSVKASYSALIAAWKKSQDVLAPDHRRRLQGELDALDLSWSDNHAWGDGIKY